MVNCPLHGTELTKVIKEWDFSHYHVIRFSCDKCQLPITAYFQDEKFVFTIPRDMQTQKKKQIIMYLQKHVSANLYDISKSLDLDSEEVLIFLKEFEDKGIAECFSTEKIRASTEK